MPRRRDALLACLLALLPLAGCVDSALDSGGESSEAPDDNSSNASNSSRDNASNVEVGGEPPPPPFPTEPTTSTTPPAPSTEPTPTTVPAEPTPAPTPPPPTPTPPPTETTPPSPTPPPPTTTTPPSPTPTSPPTPTPPPPAWPHEGSYVKYTLRTGQAFANSLQGWENYANVTWTYTNGDWRGVCVMDVHESDMDGNWDNHTETHTFTSASPPHWPPMDTRNPPAPGGSVTIWYVSGCELRNMTLVYTGPDTEPTTVNGQPVTAPTFLAEDDYPPEQPMDWRTEWSRTMGLVLYWSYGRGGMAPHSDVGHLVDTDAPLG